MEVWAAPVVGEAVTGHLSGLCPREETPADRIDGAQATLNAPAGGAGEARVRWLPAENRLTPSAVAHLLAWVLLRGSEGAEA
jgi:hypothetical protein